MCKRIVFELEIQIHDILLYIFGFSTFRATIKRCEHMSNVDKCKKPQPDHYRNKFRIISVFVDQHQQQLPRIALFEQNNAYVIVPCKHRNRASILAVSWRHCDWVNENNGRETFNV